MKKFRLKWQRYFEHYDVKKSYSDFSPGMSYGKIPFHQILNFKIHKKYSNKNLFPPCSQFTNNINHTLKFKNEFSRYNTDLIFIKLYNEYYNFDNIMTNMIYRKIQYVPLVNLFFDISLWYRIDCYVSLCKNWNEFISDSFLEFHNNFHHLYNDKLGSSYFTYFDSKMQSIFYKNYVNIRDQDDEDLKTLSHRLSWSHPDSIANSDTITCYSNYQTIFNIVSKDIDQKKFDQLDPHLVSSPDFLDMF